MVTLESRLGIPLEPGSKTLPHVAAESEIERLSGIKKDAGKIVWAYYLGRAVTASTLMPTDEHNRMGLECWHRNIQALEEMVKEVRTDHLLRAGYNKGVIHELVARNILLPSRVA